MKFALLDPRPGAENEMLDSVCLGVEVTIPKLANRCKLGNLDGQHGTGISRGEDCCVDPPEWRGHPAVLLAARGHGDCAFTLNDGEFDVGDVTLVTVRPDVDSIAAMAVIVLRKTRLFQSTYLGLDRRVNRIAMSDSFAAGLLPWRSRPLPSREDMWAHGLASVSDTEELSTLAVLCSPWRGQTEVPLEMRVAVTAMWLMFGPPKDGAWESREAREYASIINTACGVDNMLAAVYLGAWVQARRTRMALVDAIESGEIVPRLWDARGRFVIVESAHPGALRVGNFPGGPTSGEIERFIDTVIWEASQ